MSPLFEFKVEATVDAPLLGEPQLVRRYVRVEADDLDHAVDLIDELGDEVYVNAAVVPSGVRIEPVEEWGPEDSRRRAVRDRQLDPEMEVTR
jgi:hypothetical protein